ncbi:HK97 family phage prohead protease [Brevibacterium otitidis]|uniref:HK97 family phage prohead protease n=1 Tax=Brevibacterium otitidis TaxID=53364 RepID=A0ABV5X4N0_9MICO|nr:hypothetical protein GCM10023233_27420 [Brevibacterium otitidis]
MTRPTTITAIAEVTATAAPERTISGQIVAFDTESSHGIVIAAGALAPRQPLRRVKLLVDHDHSQPIGYMVALDGTAATFHVPPGAAGDAALADAQTGRRDGLSIGCRVLDGTYDDTTETYTVTSAELFEVSLCAIPAFADAQIETVAAAMTTTPKGHTMTETPKQPEVQADTTPDPVSAKQPEGQAAAFPQPPARVEAVTDRAMSLTEVTEHVAAAISTGHPGQITAALTDVVPADDKGTGWIGREDWLGELWAATRTGRPHIDAFGPPKQLNSMKMRGWQWDTRPKPAKYDGNKTEVPTNKVATKAIEATAHRWAGGWDIDRIFIDLADPGFLAAFWQAAMLEYQRDSDTDVLTTLLNAATTGTASTGVLAAITSSAAAIRKIGGSMSHLFISDDLFAAYADLRSDEVPFWLARATGTAGVSLSNGKADVADLTVLADPDLPTGTVLAADKRAATVYEKSPIQVQALDIARGGIDLGFFSYGGVLVNDPRALIKTTVTPASPPESGGGRD